MCCLHIDIYVLKSIIDILGVHMAASKFIDLFTSKMYY